MKNKTILVALCDQTLVIVNPVTNNMRPYHSLCSGCSRANQHCPRAEFLRGFCEFMHVATMVTRCPDFTLEENGQILTDEVARQNHHNASVWTNVSMDKMRRSECLCLNCHNCGNGLDGELCCPYSRLLFNFCRITDIALMITFCPTFKEKLDADPT